MDDRPDDELDELDDAATGPEVDDATRPITVDDASSGWPRPAAPPWSWAAAWPGELLVTAAAPP